MKVSRENLLNYKLWRLRHELVFLGLILILFFLQTRGWIFNVEPATGGDTGSHFWPLVTLVKEALPNFSVRVWNPGNLGGEPHLTHYFPLPYLLMAFLSLFVPLGQAFNIGTILPVLIYPFCFFWTFRRMGYKGLQPLLASALSLVFLYIESFSMWGGNALSTLAGQFAHLYALSFFVLGVGEYIRGLRRGRISNLAVFYFAAVLISHFYVALFIPIFFAGTLLNQNHWKKYFRIALWTGAMAFLLSAWFVIPMLQNSPWNTAFGLQWNSKNIFLEAFPPSSWPVLVVLAACFLYALLKGHSSLFFSQHSLAARALLFLGLTSLAMYKIFPLVGLVDIRIFPVLYIAIVGLTTLLVNSWLRDLLPTRINLYKLNYYLIILAGFFMILAESQIQNFPDWVRWNYSSWSTKSAFGDLKKLTEDLRGSYSDPRVIYENSELSNAAGTMRVFEMLPYFSQRSTWESVYMQSTIMAPAAFYLQALISQTPSCPFPNYQCTSYEPRRALIYSRLMAVGDWLLIDPEVRKKAEALGELEKKGDYGIWHWYRMRLQPSYVIVPTELPQSVPSAEYKSQFYDWFLHYQGEESFLWTSRKGELLEASAIAGSEKKCHPQVTVTFNQISLITDCENVLHILKFAYHPNFVSNHGETLYLMSPGFIGIIPTDAKTILHWRAPGIWIIADILSGMTLLILGCWSFYHRRLSRKLNLPAELS